MKRGSVFLRHKPMKIFRYLLTAMTFLVLSYTNVFAAEGLSRQELLASFWSPTSEAERLATEAQLIESTGDVAALYRWLKAGPDFSADIPRGQQESVRIADDGTRFPYVYLIPETYDPHQPHR